MATATMRAAVRGSSGISFATDVPVPTPSANQVLVKVKAAGINPADYKIPKFIGGKIVGLECAGIVEATGRDVSTFAKGDEIFGFAVMGNGGVAEYALADVAKITKKPAGLAWKCAGAMATTFVTSYQCLTEHGGLQAGGAVCILGASGGCGTAAVQLAKAMGASEVVAVCSAANHELCTKLGASRCVDYNDAAGWRALVSDRFDVVYDCASGSGAGEDYSGDASTMLKTGGTVVAINGGIGSWLRLLCKLQSSSRKLMLTRQNGEDLATCLELCGNDAVIVDSTYALDAGGVQSAFARLKSRRAKGKVVFEVSGLD
jgi:NADPH:quinone reductase-like Zn-dependent oxidoreductase